MSAEKASINNDEKGGKRFDFIRQIVSGDAERAGGRLTIHTRFPPEPNGYLHIGHSKSICLNFGIAREFGGLCNLRFDDTNPSKEEMEYVDSIKNDIKWLGFDWRDREYYSSDYFEQLYEWAVHLIKEGKAFVCDLNAEEIRSYRGTLTGPGKNSPYRDRPVEENLSLFEKMRAGEFPDGSRTLRAKIDMASPNLNMRDPVLYRILRANHHRTGDRWCIYPMYDFAHGQSDAIEGITHSLCTLEFEDHRPLYDWFIEHLPVPCKPRQIEFARLNLTHTVMSKRKLLQLVSDKHVAGWDDPRMPTLSGMRRRGYTPSSIRTFCDRIGLAKSNSTVDITMLEDTLREELNKTAQRRMAVLRPLKVIIDNYPENQVEEMQVPNNPEDPEAGSRKVPFSREIYIERADFMEDPPKKFFRLAPGREVRLRAAYFITCKEVIKDPESGEIKELHCEYDPETRGGSSPDGRKVRGTLHWVSASKGVNIEVRLYDHLFMTPNPGEGGTDWKEDLNPDSVEILKDSFAEPALLDAPPGFVCQFERTGYFCVDRESQSGHPVFNRTVTLRDTWAKMMKKKAVG